MILSKILYDMISSSAPIILCVLGGNFAHAANVLNISLEGMVLIGAFVATLVTMHTGSILLAIGASILVTIIVGAIFSFMSVTKQGNPIVAGLAINLLAISSCAFALKAMNLPNLNANGRVDISDIQLRIPVLADIPVLGPALSGHSPTTYLAYLAIALMVLLMYHTKFGVHVRVVGENEDAATSVGINASRIKYVAILIGAVCCAFAGENLAVEKLALFTNGMSAGIGFIAIAAIFCGRGRPIPTAMYSIAFGLAQSLAINLNLSAGPASGLFNTIPYMMIVIILAAVSITQRKNVRVRGISND